MGALYEDVEKFFGDIFAQYGRWVARYPVVFIVLSLVTSSLLGMGLVSLRYENQVVRLYTPMDSQAFKDQGSLSTIFKEDNRNAYYSHQLVYDGTFGEVIVLPRDTSDDSNVLQPVVISELWKLYQTLADVVSEDGGFGYPELCAIRGGQCVVDGLNLLESLKGDPQTCLPSNTSQELPDGTGYTIHIEDVLGHMTSDNHCLRAATFKLRFNLAHDIKKTRAHALSWERQFLRTLQKYSSPHLDLAYAVSGSLDIELADDLALDTKYFALTIVIMVIYASFVTSGGDWVSTRMLLAQAGVLAALLSILASFGLLCMCGLMFVDICGVMPFLVLGIGLDDMFIILSGWRRADLPLSLEDRIAETFRTSAISVTITSLTDLLAFCIGATSPFLSVKNFCIFAGVAVFFCYVNQLMFFGGCLVLHARRVLASRHCLTCRTISNRQTMQSENRIYSKAEIFCCSGEPPQEKGKEDSLCEKIPNTILPKLLLKVPTKIFVLALFIVYIVISIWGASRIKTGVKLKDMVPETSYFTQYLDYHRTYYGDRGTPVMFVLTQPLDYNSEKVQSEVRRVLTRARASGYVYSDTISWMEAFLDFLEHKSLSPGTSAEFLSILQTDFLPQNSQYQHDVVVNEEGDSIIASRFYLSSHTYNDSDTEASMMTTLRSIVSNCTYPMTAYSPDFIYFEHYVSILKNTLLAVGVAIIGMLFIALMFIPHPISITCVTITMVTIVLGMFGCMTFWSLELSAVTKVQIILSVGFCVDFTVHISHAFMTATGKNRNERVMAALEKVGIPILNGAFTSILGILMLAFARSYVYKSFFKTMLLVILLGIGHSLLLLPVVLSFIGPRRTAKTVFVPVHHTARSIMCDTSPSTSRRQADAEPSSPSTKEEDLSDGPHSPREEIELIKIDSEDDQGINPRKVLTPVNEEPDDLGLCSVRFKVVPQDSVDTESFQSLDIMNT